MVLDFGLVNDLEYDGVKEDMPRRKRYTLFFGRRRLNATTVASWWEGRGME